MLSLSTPSIPIVSVPAPVLLHLENARPPRACFDGVSVQSLLCVRTT